MKVYDKDTRKVEKMSLAESLSIYALVLAVVAVWTVVILVVVGQI